MSIHSKISHVKNYPATSLTWVSTGIVLINLFVFVLAGLSLWQSRIQYEERAAITTQNLAQVLEQTIDGCFAKIDLILLSTTDEIEKRLAEGDENRRDIESFFARQAKRMPELEALRMTNAQGEIVVGAGKSVGSLKSVADRHYFRILKADPKAGLILSKPVESRVTGAWVLILARSMKKPDGSFAGVVYGVVPLEHFRKLLSTVDVGKHGVISLRDGDLKILARYPDPRGTGGTVGRKGVSKEFQKLLAAGQKSGTFTARPPVDNVRRLYSFRKSSNFPVYINVGLSTDDIFAEWRRDHVKTAAAVLLFCLFTLWASWRIWRDWKLRNEAVKALVSQEAKFRTFDEYTHGWEFWLDPDGTFMHTSPSCKRITGYEASEFYGDPGLLLRLIHPEDLEQYTFFQRQREVLTGNECDCLVFRIRHRDGAERWLELVFHSIIDESGTFLGTRGSIRDISKRKLAEQRIADLKEERLLAVEKLRNSEATLRSITSSTRDAIVMIDDQGKVSFWNEAAEQIFGWNKTEAVGKDIHLLIIPENLHEAFLDGMRRFSSSGTGAAIGTTIELPVLCRDTTEIPVEVSLSSVSLKGRWYGVGIIRDIRERKRIEAEIQLLAYHDALTGLPNRLLLDDRLNQAIAHAAREGHMTAVLMFDLDNFKSVNDTLGHPAGDRLLKKVVERVRKQLRKSDTIARMGGDEFIVVLSEIHVPEDAAHTAHNLLEKFLEPFELDQQEIYTSVSVGISLYPIDGVTTESLLKNADIAMNHVKQHGRNSFYFYTEEINSRTEERLLLENDLRHAVAREEFVLHYQPWLDLESGMVGGVEALIRWEHPRRGLIPPDRFISIAEETGLIIPIGEWVVKSACRYLRGLHRSGLTWMTMSLNVSGKQLRSPNLIGLIGLVLAEIDVDPAFLEIELTESSVMENVEESRCYMDALKMIGVRLALDDFGTGYSSLSYLKRFPLDRLKIDRSFVRDCPANVDDVAIARAIIALARTLNLQVTAEGVETLEQSDFFIREGCNVIQGNLIGKPIPGSELLTLLSEEVSMR
jgi:diguanylate cyclase (GGDEF)-like protein/PAS domain S-box-containing protein